MPCGRRGGGAAHATGNRQPDTFLSWTGTPVQPVKPDTRCSPGGSPSPASACWIGAVQFTSCTAAVVVATCVIRWGRSSSHVSVRTAAYPVQCIPRLLR